MLEQRLEFCRLVEAGGVSFAELCRRFGVKRDTGYKWLSRFATDGEAGLGDRARTPHRQPARTGAAVEELVCGVREAHPAWGGRKIRGFLLTIYYRHYPIRTINLSTMSPNTRPPSPRS